MPSLKRLSIRAQLTIMVASTLAVLVLIVVFTYVQVTGIVVRNNQQYADEVMAQIGQSFDANVGFLDHLMLGVQYDPFAQEYLATSDPLKRYDLFSKLDTNFLNLMNLREGLLDVVLIGDNGTTYFFKGRQEVLANAIHAMAQNTGGRGTRYSTLLSLTYDGEPHECFLLVSDIISRLKDTTTGMHIGVAAVVFDRSALGTEAVDALQAPASSFYLVDRAGTVFAGNDPDSLFAKLSDSLLDVPAGESRTVSLAGEPVSVRTSELGGLDARIVNVTRTTALVGDLVRVRNLSILLVAASGLFLLGLFLLFARNIVRPLNQFMAHLARIGSGSLDGRRTPAELDGYAEISVMADRFNAMLEEIDALAKSLLASNSRMYEMELQKKQAEIAQLKSQINPHFLYNSLESMKGVALSEHAEKVFQMLTALGRMFYYSFKGADIVRVREEMTTIQSYIRIQQVRFEDRFTFETDVPEALMDCLIPKMCLQPLVENAVFHGLETKEGPGHLRIEGRIADGDVLTIRIVDDGVGIEPERLAALQAQFAATTPPDGIMKPNPGTVGLMNVHSRVRLMHGADYGLTVESEPGKGSGVTLRLPVRRDDA